MSTSSSSSPRFSSSAASTPSSPPSTLITISRPSVDDDADVIMTSPDSAGRDCHDGGGGNDVDRWACRRTASMDSGQRRDSIALSEDDEERRRARGGSGSTSGGSAGAADVQSVQSSPGSGGRRKRNWLHKGSVLRDELDALGSGLRKMGASLRGSVECLVSNCALSSNSSSLITAACKPLYLDQRRIRVELIGGGYEHPRASSGRCGNRRTDHHRGGVARRCGNRRGGDPRDDDYDDDPSTSSWPPASFDAPDHNYTSCLTVGGLADGVFTARLDLGRIPRGDITLRVRNYRLEVIVDRAEPHHAAAASGPNGYGPASSSSAKAAPLDDAHRVTRPYYCGSVDVPIYVDTATMQFRSDEAGGDALYIRARMKGYVDPNRLSASFGDVRDDHASSSRHHHKTNKLPGALGGDDVTATSASAVAPGGVTRNSPLANHPNWVTLFRDRAYTR